MGKATRPFPATGVRGGDRAGAGRGPGSEAFAARKESEPRGRRARGWVPGYRRYDPGETLTPQRGDPCAGSSGLWSPPGSDSVTSPRPGSDRHRSGAERTRFLLRAARGGGPASPRRLGPASLGPAPRERRAPEPHQSRPRSPFANVLVLRRHCRRRCASAELRLVAG